MQLERLANSELQTALGFHNISPPLQGPENLPALARLMLADLPMVQAHRILDQARQVAYNKFQQVAQHQKGALLFAFNTRAARLRRWFGEATGSFGNDAGPSRPHSGTIGVRGADAGTGSPSTTATTTGGVAQDNVAPKNCPLRTSPKFEALLHVCECWLERYLNTKPTD